MRTYDIDSLDNRSPRQADLIARFVRRTLAPYFRYQLRGTERIPEGAALYVGNHSGGILTPDSFLLFGEVMRSKGLEDLPYGLGHEVAIRLPIAHQIVVPIGAVRASHENAHRVFAQGGKVMVYPGGDVDNQRPFRHRHRVVFGGRKGYVRLALREGVPISPVVTAGGHSTFVIVDDLRWLAKLSGASRFFRVKVMPLTLSIPWGLTLGPVFVYWPLPSRILAEILEPIRFERSGPEAAEDESYVAACADRVETAMQDALTRLAEERRRMRRLFPHL
jgi:1-acyl-sn-glycerol-3-phosphate acyltransferase